VFDVVCVFFFSSRRRHTRCYRDWSSDVCSSDLTPVSAGVFGEGVCSMELFFERSRIRQIFGRLLVEQANELLGRGRNGDGTLARSEERRVGKEWRGRWAVEQ